MRDLLTNRLRITTEARFDEDWTRQRRTAVDILHRLETQEGVILADQVGMGKTYVALAVAVSRILSTEELGQVVIFVPASVADKWVREWRKFNESLLEAGSGIRCVDQPIRSGEELLKKLDDSPAERRHILVVTHTALTATLKDSFIQLALLHYATRHLRNGEGTKLRQRIAKWSNGRHGLFRDAQFTTDRVGVLLDTSPSKWRHTWRDLTGEELTDDPVPAALEGAARNMSLLELRAAIHALPINWSEGIQNRLKTAREELGKITQATWKWILSSIELDIPLLIVDEAHRLKNPWTQISKLFGKRTEGTGAFSDIFRRMLFLTATPFELGHSELIEVLSRMGSIRPLESPPAHSLKERLDKLAKVLTDAQESALTFDDAWGRLTSNDAAVFEMWGLAVPPPAAISPATREAWEHAKFAVQTRRLMHTALQPWVIRHERLHRREYHPGAAITETGGSASGGLHVPECAALPFLLAARAQSVALDEKGARPLFAYGIASSYEAFSRLSSGESDGARDSDLPEIDREAADGAAPGRRASLDAVAWYQREIARALKGASDSHPKVQATVEKAASLWLDGEKCLVFCWFIKTGEAVERALVKRVDALIHELAAEALGTVSDEETDLQLDRISDRIFRRNAQAYERIRQRLVHALSQTAGQYKDVVDFVADAAIRHLRTANYLVRFTNLRADITDEEVWAGINGSNRCGVVLLDRWRHFAERLVRARTQIGAMNPKDEHDSEFVRIRADLLGTTDDDNQAMRRGASLHPVRRAYGGTERSVRERLITLFNTPFSPDLLVASSVMGEGIDLHQECRFVIHHDLDWNPSVLEQRTGRLDRIGALAEREGKNIQVYEPYLAGTHDEKMFRVVKDRAQWFDIVMGRQADADDHVTDAEECRVPLYESIRKALAMDLRSPER